MADAPAVFINGLIKRYGDVVAVDGLDLQIPRGECFGLLGPNGAGKTTTIEICEGLTQPDAGQVRILGLDHRRSSRRIRSQIGVSLQDTQLPDKLTVTEVVELFRSFYPKPLRTELVIDAVELREKRSARVAQLSGGQRQRLALACALAGQPELFFLDEPTTGLDPQSRRHLWTLIEALRAEGRTIVLTTHYMEEAQRLCDRVAIMDHGRIIALGAPRQLIAQLGSEHVVDFRVEGGSYLPEADLLMIPGVYKVRREGSHYWLDVQRVHQTMPAILAELKARHVTIADIAAHPTSLEDVFVHLTGRQLRDG